MTHRIVSGPFRSAASGLWSALCACAVVQIAPAALLLNPAGGTVRVSADTGVTDKDDGAFAGAYVFFGTDFFGEDLVNPAPTVSINGFIRFDGGDGFGDSFLRPLGASGATRISPMWHDFTVGAGGEVIEHAAEDFSYYGVTWSNMESTLHPGGFATFQAIFFESATTIQGNSFLPGDIAFSYGDLGFYDMSDDAIVGLENDGAISTLSTFVPTNGAASKNYYGDFPVGESQYIRFRPDGAGGYEVSLQSIPEPGVALLGAIGVLGWFRRNRRG